MSERSVERFQVMDLIREDEYSMPLVLGEIAVTIDPDKVLAMLRRRNADVIVLDGGMFEIRYTPKGQP